MTLVMAGWAVSLAESCFSAKGLGLEIVFDGEFCDRIRALWRARCPRNSFGISRSACRAVWRWRLSLVCPAREIGKVTRDNGFRIQYNGHVVLSASG